MKKLLLCIMDGIGIRDNTYGNAVKQANTPNLDYLMKTYPNSLLEASETAVGLPIGQMGNSEVGHMNIGTGRIVNQSLDIISNSINDGSLSQNNELLNLIKHVKENDSDLHICGLLSDGGIHSHIDHLMGLIDILKNQNINVYYHIFTDGRDTLPNTSLSFIKKLEEKIKETGVGKISTISGRYYAMDRDNNWDRIQKVYHEMTEETGIYKNAETLINNNYEKGVTDEFVIPGSLNNGIIKNNDGILVFNFRPDRLRELFSAFTDKFFNEFETKDLNLYFVCFTQYDETMPNVKVAFKPTKLNNTFGEYISKKGYKQLRIAETEKYAHVTFFFNGGEEKVFEGEDRILVPSPKVATYDLKPEMSAYEVTEKLLEAIDEDKYENIILNYANPDMVGHTGILDAAIKAIETVDECVRKSYRKS